MREIRYKDRIILALRLKCREMQLEQQEVNENIPIGINQVPLHREMMFEGKCSMLLPDNLRDMSALECAAKYRNKNRPQVIKTDDKGDVSFTFSMVSDNDFMNRETGILEKLEKIRCDMKKVWKQNVFYDTGEIKTDTISVAWMDFKAFCFNAHLYCMLFIFEVEDKMVLGNFHCSFPQYDIWKPAVLRLLTTIRLQES